MADIPGVQGLKGFMGDKGLPGENDKCFCDTHEPTNQRDSIQSLDINRDIQTREITNMESERVGTVIYHDDDNEPNTQLIVGREQYSPA
tara:strand:+ start:82 stop:348 length:267 start_codon:yes stop_codon:yes gene_type:complete